MFNGQDGQQKIYLCVKNQVFDVSSKPGFYGPGGMYENFAGRDASRGLAKNSFDQNVLTPLDQPIDLLKDLNDEEKQALDEWEQFFINKYTLVGHLVNPI